ncbi:MAG: beta-N-acetylhexosaminidase [Deltaproteobacteria bacterium]|nr:MAG: beta-N-acetylhexosaminidase [Deltaproteobacteria bacterium]
MELQERLGELLVVGFPGQQMDTSLATHIRNLRPAGLILFKRNIVSPEQLARLTLEIQKLSLRELGRPLLLAVDQEGGTVARMPPPFTQFPDAATLGTSGCDSVRSNSGIIAQEMSHVGLNLNLAPVLDVNLQGSTGLMRLRAYGNDPSLVARCGVAAISATQGKKIMATAKHFPGLGRAQEDPHDDLPVVAASKEDFYRNDLLPFRAAIQAEVACVMTSHTLYPDLDPENPGSFSPAILRGLLREHLSYDGVVITDDLEMGAVAERYSPEDAAIAALKAGADLLLVCNDVEKMYRTGEAIRDGLSRGFLDSSDLVNSLLRLDILRKAYLRHPNLVDPAAVAAYFSA